jgi:hypothetical protein
LSFLDVGIEFAESHSSYVLALILLLHAYVVPYVLIAAFQENGLHVRQLTGEALNPLLPVALVIKTRYNKLKASLNIILTEQYWR